MAERETCSGTSRAASEPMYGTASQVRRWIVVEQPGPWGADAVLQSRLPVDVGARLLETARRLRARVLLIRRHGRYEPVGRCCFTAVTTAERQEVRRLDVSAPADLLDVDFDPLGGDEPVGTQPVESPLYLVCTNGRHDACCAEHGRPLAKALSAARPDATWEVSHIGGDRFAGNLLVLPDGLYYGRLDPAEAVALADAHEDGRITIDHLRGRSWLPFPAQAAEHHLRAARGLDRLDDLRFLGGREHDGHYRARFAGPDGEVRAVVAVRPAPEVRRLTCGAARAVAPPVYELVDLAMG